MPQGGGLSEYRGGLVDYIMRTAITVQAVILLLFIGRVIIEFRIPDH